MAKTEWIDRPADDDEAWFVPHMFGIGATPVTWQGWAMTIGFVALAMLVTRFVHEEIARTALVIALIVLFTVFASRKTRGGFRWRWGDGA